MKNCTGNFILLFILLALNNCANQIPPSGGSKDELPPKVLRVTPANEKITFQSRQILYEFDEYFDVTDWSNQLIVSPPLEEALKYKIKGKTLTITLPEELLTNTTYSIQFGKAIQDLNERNSADDLQYIFSTGEYLDSLKISGSITKATDNAPIKDGLIMLYPPEQDSILTKTKPLYFSKSDENGNFSIEYIKEGEYHVRALLDKNSNYLYDQRSELIGFIKEPIKVSENIGSIELSLFQESDPDLRMSVQNIASDLIQLCFNHSVPGDYSIENLQEISNCSTWNNTRDTLLISLKNTGRQKIYLLNAVTKRVDSLTALTQTDEFTPAETKIDTIILKHFPNKENKLQFTRALNEILQTKATAKNNHDSIEIQLSKSAECTNSLNLTTPKPNHSNYHLEIPGEIILSYDNTPNQPLQIQIQFPTQEKYGTINLEIPNSTEQSIVYLLKKNESTLAKFTESIRIHYLTPGTYSLWKLHDLNQNFKWDTGNLSTYDKPEKITLVNKSIEVRANWENNLKIEN